MNRHPEQRITNNFGGPTPPPAVEKRVFAAARKARVSTEDSNPYGKGSSKTDVSNQKAKQTIETEQTMSDNIVFPCPACGMKYNVGPQHAGKQTKCKKCGATITVPTPQAENQTVMGMTRTIRRADISPGSSAREAAAPPVVSAPAPATEVDMGGGSSVLRKGGTLSGDVKPVPAGPRPMGRPAGPGRSTRAPAGRPMPHGHGEPHAKKKGNTGLIIGIVSGVVAILLVVVIVVASSGPDGPGTGGDGSGEGGTVAKELTKAELIAAQLKDWENVLNSEQEDIEGLQRYYADCKVKAEKNDNNPDYIRLGKKFAELAIDKSSDLSAIKEAKFLLKMADAGFANAEDKFPDSLNRLMAEKLATNSYKEGGREKSKIDPTFEKIALRLGWGKYKEPDVFVETYNLYHLEALEAYREVANEVQFGDESGNSNMVQELYGLGLLSPKSIEKMKAAEAVVVEEAEALEAQDKKDGYAIAARQAFFRFLRDNRSSKKYDVKKGKKSFCPAALGRGRVYKEGTKEIVDPGEKIEDIWTYTYAKPFIVYVEKPADGGELSEEFIEQLRQKALILKDIEVWFRSNIIDEFGLKRVKPLGPAYAVRDKNDNLTGEYETPAEKAEKEEWPMEVVIFKDDKSFLNWANKYTGDSLPDGVRAMYSPPASTVVTWDHRETGSEEDNVDNLETLVHEVFHQLSDYHVANPINYKQEEYKERIRYTSVLVQEGLTESIAAFKRTGEGADAKYEFGAPNIGRIKDFFGIHDRFIGDFLFTRIENLLDIMTYGMINPVFRNRGVDCQDQIKDKNFVRFILPQLGMGLYYASACMAGYFFYHYEVDGDYVYRDVWWEYIRQDYTGELDDVKKLYSAGYDHPGLVRGAFAKVFELKSDGDWDRLNDEFWEFIQVLRDEIEDEDAVGDSDEATEGPEEYAMAGAGHKQYGWLRDEE